MDLQLKVNFQEKQLSERMKHLSTGEKMIFWSGIAALISLFLPWQDLGLLGSLPGISDYAWLPFLLGWGLPIYMIFTQAAIRNALVLGGGCIAFLWGVIYLLQAKVENPFADESISTASWGVLIFCPAALALVVGIILKSKVKNADELVSMVREDIRSFKK